MKTVVSVLFGILTAAVIGVAMYVWLDIRTQNRSLFDERRDLEEQIAQLTDDLSRWQGFPENYETMHAEMDSIKDTLTVIEVKLTGYLKGLGVSKLVVEGPEEGENYRSYACSFRITGKPDTVDSLLGRLQNDLPFTRIQVFEAVLKSRRLELDLSGDIRFPK